MRATGALLHELVASAGLPAVVSFRPVRGHGFDHEILHATLADSRQVVIRHRPQESRPLPLTQARFLADHDVPAPELLGGNEFATLYGYAPGEMLSALVAEGRVSDHDWRSAGTAFRRLHAVRFPSRLTGIFEADGLNLRPRDPVAALHEQLDQAEPILKVNLPVVVRHLPRLHVLIDENAQPLRDAPTALLHWDVNPANIIVGPDQTTLIDWGDARVGDSAKEIAALEEHIYLIDRSPQLPASFYETYGPRPTNTALHRLTGALTWYTEGNFDGWDLEEDLDPALQAKVDAWREGLATYLSDIGDHLKAF
jgi:aminoglycoside phosphotransferase (APT) family kinase protein